MEKSELHFGEEHRIRTARVLVGLLLYSGLVLLISEAGGGECLCHQTVTHLAHPDAEYATLESPRSGWPAKATAFCSFLFTPSRFIQPTFWAENRQLGRRSSCSRQDRWIRTAHLFRFLSTGGFPDHLCLGENWSYKSRINGLATFWSVFNPHWTKTILLVTLCQCFSTLAGFRCVDFNFYGWRILGINVHTSESCDILGSI